MHSRTSPRRTSRRPAVFAVFALLAGAWIGHAPRPALAGLTCDPGMNCAKLGITAPGAGAGTITGHGISCMVDNGVKTGDCVQEFNFPGGSLVVDLTMTAAPGSTYLDSTGHTHGPGVPVVERAFLLPDDENTQYKEAIFKLGWQTITLAFAGAGSGVIHHTEDGVECPTDCKVVFQYGDTGIIVIAIPDPGSYFKSWSGPCAGQGAGCQFDMPRSTTMTVTFGLKAAATATPKPPTPSPTAVASKAPGAAPTVGPSTDPPPSSFPPSTSPTGSEIPSEAPATSAGPVATPFPSAAPIATTSSDPGFGSGLLIGLLVAGIVALVGGLLLWKRRAVTPQ